jgi:uncharacterized protein (DUF58 family)
VNQPVQLVPSTRTARALPARRFGAAFGRRFYFYLLVGLVWLGPMWFDRRYAWGLLAWNALLALVWALDLRRLPNPSSLEVARHWSSPPGLTMRGTVELEFANPGAEPLEVVATDDVPPQLARRPPEVTLRVPPRGRARAAFEVIPVARGDAAVGQVYFRYQSRLGMAERWGRAPLDQTVRVYPDLDEAKRQTIYLIRSRQIELEKRLRRQRGQGREFESLREYRDGDEWRDICWTATARRGKLVAKVHQVERSQNIWLVLDAGRLLRAKVGQLSKLDYAANAALTLAQVALHSGDRIGLIAYGRTIQQRLGAGRGNPHLRAAIEQLALVRGEAAEADHPRAARALLHAQSRRALVVWLTDLADTVTTPEVIEAAARLSPPHLVLFVVIRQRELKEIVWQRPANAKEMFRRVAAQEMLERRDLLLRQLRQRGVLAVEIEPRKLSTALINHYLDIKQRSRL